MDRLRSIFFADDKDVFDLLQSAKKRITEKGLLELARDRGIFLSEKEPRDSLVDYLANLPHDYHDVAVLVDQTESTQRREALTSLNVQQATTEDEVLSAIKRLQAARSEQPHEGLVATVDKGEGRIRLRVAYSDVDFAKTRLRQRTEKEATIEISVHDGHVSVRHPANDYIEAIAEAFLHELAPPAAPPPARRVIDLAALRTARDRTLFFTRVIRRIDGFRLDDVVRVKVYQPPLQLDQSALGQDEPGDDLMSESEQSDSHAEAACIVRQVLLTGEGLLLSPEYQSLESRGFFIGEIRWFASEGAVRGRRIELSASARAESARLHLTYRLHGVQRRNKDGELKSRLESVGDREQRELVQLLEAAATSVYDELNLVPASIDVTEGGGTQ